jgi:uncharacterized membrane protein YkgB
MDLWSASVRWVLALGSCGTFIATSTIISFFPDGWAVSAGGFPAMTEHVAFLVKDLVLFTASFCLLKHDLVKAALVAGSVANRGQATISM